MALYHNIKWMTFCPQIELVLYDKRMYASWISIVRLNSYFFKGNLKLNFFYFIQVLMHLLTNFIHDFAISYVGNATSTSESNKL